jgi:hypothetical protein
MMKYKRKTVVLLGSIFAALSLSGQSTLVTISEDSSRTTSTLSNVDVFDFNSLQRGRNENVSWDGVGTFDAVHVAIPNVWGGAVDESTGSASNFSWVGSKWVATSTLTLDQSSSYFGFWWSAGDANNQLSFYSGSDLVARYSTASMFGSLDLSQEYYGNPLTGGNASEPYAFINFYGDENTSWDTIEITQIGTGAGFESDNYTSRVAAFNAATDGDIDGNVIAEVSGTTTNEVSEITTWNTGSSFAGVPAAPTPTTGVMILFGALMVMSAAKTKM